MSAAPDLGDFFKNKGKKKIKGSNLNVAKPEAKAESKKAGKKDAEEEGWEEQEVVAATMKVEVAGKLMREEDNKDEVDNSAPAWGSTRKNKGESHEKLNEKRFPTLASSIIGMSSNINIDDGSNAKINIETSKNAFASLGGGEDSDDEVEKRPNFIKPAMVQKKKGEFEKVAVQREVDKYTKKEGTKKKKEKTGEEGEDEDEDDEEEEIEEEEVPSPKEVKKEEKKVVKKKVVEKEEAKEEEKEDVAEDLKIVPDLIASKSKYTGRKRLEPKDLPREELEEEKADRPKPGAGSKKKKNFVDEEELYSKGKKLAVWED